MTAIAAPIRRPRFVPGRLQSRVVVLTAIALSGLLLFALLRRLGSGHALLPIGHSAWLTLHLMTVIPAVPLGAYVLIRRKGDRLHKLLGRAWALMMIGAALSSFGLKGLTGGFSWIHLLSILTLVTIPRGVIQAMRRDFLSHQRSMTLTYAGLVGAGLFTFVPGRLLASWLFG